MTAIDDLTDAASSSPSTKELLVYDGSNYANRAIELEDLADVNSGSPQAGYVLIHNGTHYVHRVLVEADISDLQNYSLSTHNHDLDDLSNIVITSIADNELLVWDSSSSKWINQTLSETGIGNLANNETITGAWDFSANIDFAQGIDVTGNITVTGTVDGVDIATRDHDEPPEISQADAEAGTATTFSQWSAERVAQAITALEREGPGRSAVPLYANFRDYTGWVFISDDEYISAGNDVSLDTCYIYLPITENTTLVGFRGRVSVERIGGSFNITSWLKVYLEYLDDGGSWDTIAGGDFADLSVARSTNGITVGTITDKTIIPTLSWSTARSWRLRIEKSKTGTASGYCDADVFNVWVTQE